MTASFTFDFFCTLDGYGSPRPDSNWGGYWGKQGPELLARRLEVYSQAQRMVLGANTHRLFSSFQEKGFPLDPWVARMMALPTTVVSNTLEAPLDRPEITLAAGNAVDVVAKLKQASDVPLRSHGSLSMNRALMGAGLVDYIHVTLFPVVNAQTGEEPVFAGAPDFDLELLEQRTLDGGTQELIYRPSLHA